MPRLTRKDGQRVDHWHALPALPSAWRRHWGPCGVEWGGRFRVSSSSGWQVAAKYEATAFCHISYPSSMLQEATNILNPKES